MSQCVKPLLFIIACGFTRTKFRDNEIKNTHALDLNEPFDGEIVALQIFLEIFIFEENFLFILPKLTLIKWVLGQLKVIGPVPSS